MSKNINDIYPVNDVMTGFDYWVRNLTEKCIGMFDYSGLPGSLPKKELETRLIWYGFASIFNHKKFGIVTCNGSVSGIDMYNKPTTYIYNQPVLGNGILKIGKEVAILYHSEMDDDRSGNQIGLRDLIQRYARFLSDIDSSINIATVNTRAASFNVAKSDQVKQSIDAVMGQLRRGLYGTITELGVIDSFKTLPYHETKNNTIAELCLVRDNLLKSFYREIGIKTVFQKKERLITTEIESENQVQLVNLQDMLEKRQEGLEVANGLFGLDISVRISDAFVDDSIGGLVSDEDY